MMDQDLTLSTLPYQDDLQGTLDGVHVCCK